MSVVTIFIVGSCLQIAAAATVGGEGAKVESFEDLVRIYTVQLGTLGRIISHWAYGPPCSMDMLEIPPVTRSY